jgi:hypothetical protein
MKPGRPSATITVDGRKLTAPEAGLVGLRISLATSAHDSAELTLWPRSKFASASIGSTISISLGTTDGEEDVLSGEVCSLTQKPPYLLIGAVSSTIALSRSRRSQMYLSSSVSDIVADLAGSVDVDTVQADLQLEAYSVDTRRTVWGHLNDLAMLSGAEVGVSSSGGLRFVPVRTGSADRTLRYGADVLDWNVASLKRFDPPGVAPHGAGSEAGSSRWHWLIRDPLGSGAGPSRVIGAFHTRDAADQLQSALKDRAGRSALCGEIATVGNSKIRPGELVEISDFPGADPGVMRVLAVNHHFGSSSFVTVLQVEA